MRLLDRYLLRELLLPLGYCLSGFLIFWITFDLLKEMDTFQHHQLSLADICGYYLVRVPELLVIILPVALLLALLYALSNHARHHEIVAMRAAGQGLWRIGAPYLGVGLVFSGLLFYLNETWVPNGTESAEEILQGHRRGSRDLTDQIHRQLNFRNDRDGRTWTIGAYNARTGEMLDPQVEWTQPDGQRPRLIAKRAEPGVKGWVFYQAYIVVFDPARASSGAPVQTNRIEFEEFSETPALIRSEVKVNAMTNVRAAKGAELSIAEVRDYLKLHPRLPPAKQAQLLTQLHGRIAEPWTCLVVVLVALPFGAASGRRNVFVGVANSIFICFGYFILMKLGLALGTGGYVPAWLAAWFPNGLFGGLGVWLTHRVR